MIFVIADVNHAVISITGLEKTVKTVWLKITHDLESAEVESVLPRMSDAAVV
jgi:hypothetical protein